MAESNHYLYNVLIIFKMVSNFILRLFKENKSTMLELQFHALINIMSKVTQ